MAKRICTSASPSCCDPRFRCVAAALLLTVSIGRPAASAAQTPPAPKRARGVVQAATYKEALARGQKDKRDLVVFVHGPDWCRIGEIFRERVWDNSAFRKKLGDGFVLFEAIVLEKPTESQKKALEARQKGLDTRFQTYPVLVFIGPDGKRYGAALGSETERAFPERLDDAVKLIHALRDAREKRDAFLARAAKAPASEKPKWLFLACEAGADRQKELLDLLKKADPENASGYVARVGFNGVGVLLRAKKFGDGKKFEDGEKWLNEQLRQKGLTDLQKQWVYTALGNLYRRWGGHDRQAWDTFMAATKIDPKTVMGRAAERLAKKFIEPRLKVAETPRDETQEK